MYVTELDTENLHVLQNEFVTRSLSVFMDWLAGWLAVLSIRIMLRMYLCKGERVRQKLDSRLTPSHFNVSKYILRLLFVIVILKLGRPHCSLAKTKPKSRQ